jgi:hypothetical protein
MIQQQQNFDLRKLGLQNEYSLDQLRQTGTNQINLANQQAYNKLRILGLTSSGVLNNTSPTANQLSITSNGESLPRVNPNRAIPRGFQSADWVQRNNAMWPLTE